MVYFITGKAGAGKTTYAYNLRYELHQQGYSVYILDGDEVRDATGNDGFSDEDREKHILTIASYAKLAEQQNITVIIALIAPKRIWRMKAREMFQESILVYLPGGKLWKNSEYEQPDEEELMYHGDLK